MEYSRPTSRQELRKKKTKMKTALISWNRETPVLLYYYCYCYYYYCYYYCCYYCKKVKKKTIESPPPDPPHIFTHRCVSPYPGLE